jgi:hypothetical protein
VQRLIDPGHADNWLSGPIATSDYINHSVHIIYAAKARGEVPRAISNDLITQSITGAALGQAAG